MSENHVIFGWDAPPMKDQHPVLPEPISEQFDRDNEAVIRLSIRGLITPSQRDSSFKKLTRNIESAIKEAHNEDQ